MQWFALIALGLAIGILLNFPARTAVHMPPSLAIGITLLGTIFGGILNQASDLDIFGADSFYLTGTVVGFGFFVGGVLGYRLTRTERRV